MGLTSGQTNLTSSFVIRILFDHPLADLAVRSIVISTFIVSNVPADVIMFYSLAVLVQAEYKMRLTVLIRQREGQVKEELEFVIFTICTALQTSIEVYFRLTDKSCK